MDDAIMAAAAGAPETPDAAVGRLLREAGALDETGLARAARVSAETGERLDHVLTRLGLAPEPALARAYADLLGLPRVTPQPDARSAALLAALGPRFAAHARIAPLDDDGAVVRLAVADPLEAGLAEAARLKLGRAVAVCVATPAEIEAALAQMADPATAADDGDDALQDADADTAADVARLKDLASEAPVIRRVAQIIRRAAEIGASDIHLEPGDGRLRLRYRVDGVLREAEAPPPGQRAAIVSRLKIMARLNIAETRLPQDGRIRATVMGRSLDLRVATAPGLHGEGAVIRLLDREGLRLDFDGLGLDAPTQARLVPLIERPNGVVLVTGPTGSGKTTTLYAAIQRLNGTERKIVTVEDPVEYQLDGVTQIQTHAKIGLGFPEALRAILRMDPDVIMIGEIRDLDTARIAVQAALTGHLVLATLHTNSAAAAINRLRDMGLPDYLLAATVAGCVAQRLVRRLCPDCAAPETDAAALARWLGDAGDPAPFRRAVGCAACEGSGYAGRTTLMEVLAVDDAVRALILDRADERAIEDAAVAAGMRTLAGHGLARARAGETALAEIARVAAGP